MDKKRGNLFILSAPSGAGKSSLIKALIDNSEDIQVSVSHTTRNPRPGELQNIHYHFVSVEQFKEKIANDDFLEWAEVFGNYYGTSVEAVENSLNEGKHVFLDIDWQGAQQIKKRFSGVTTIFIMPPSRTELKRRLESRGQDSEDVINARMEEACSEMSHFNEFDYVVINDDFEQSIKELKAIITATNLKTVNQEINFASLFGDLLANQ